MERGDELVGDWFVSFWDGGTGGVGATGLEAERERKRCEILHEALVLQSQR